MDIFLKEGMGRGEGEGRGRGGGEEGERLKNGDVFYKINEKEVKSERDWGS